MPLPNPNAPPDRAEVIELLLRLTRKDGLRRQYLGIVVGILILGVVMTLWGLAATLDKPAAFVPLMLGLSVLATGIIGTTYLALPYELRQIARRLEQATDPDIVPTLLDSLSTALKVSSNDGTVRQLRHTLAVLLKRLSVEDSAVLTPENWDVIQRHLSNHVMLNLHIDTEDLSFTTAILDLLKRRRDTRYIATIKNITFGVGSKWKILREAVKDCLVVLEEQKRKEEESSVLLRASAPKDHSETLLRPAGYGDTQEAQELLRPNSS